MEYSKHLDKEFDDILEFAKNNQRCKRKSVGCSLVTVIEKTSLQFLRTRNGPASDEYECSNEVGNCGCCHAEPKAIIKGLQKKEYYFDCIMLCTYSPCTNCANIIIESGIVSIIIYDILTEHDIRGEKLLRSKMLVFTRDELKKGIANRAIKKWIQCHRECW